MMIKMIRESKDNVDGYAVQIHDMGKGYIHLLLFDNYNDAMDAYES